MPNSRSRNGTDGFTILEMLVAVTIGVIVTLGVFKILSTSNSASQSAISKDAAKAELDLVISQIQRDFRRRVALLTPSPYSASSGSSGAFNSQTGNTCAPCTGIRLRQTNENLTVGGISATQLVVYDTQCVDGTGGAVSYPSAATVNANLSCPSGVDGIADNKRLTLTVTTYPNESDLSQFTVETYPRTAQSLAICFRLCPGSSSVVVEGGVYFQSANGLASYRTFRHLSGQDHSPGLELLPR